MFRSSVYFLILDDRFLETKTRRSFIRADRIMRIRCDLRVRGEVSLACFQDGYLLFKLNILNGDLSNSDGGKR